MEHGKEILRKQLLPLDLRGIISYFQTKKQFSEGGKGASETEINELEKATGIPFPEDYRTFLEFYGNGTGNLFPEKGVAFGLDAAGKRTYNYFDLKYGFTIKDIRPHFRGQHKKNSRDTRIADKVLLIGIQRYSEDGGCYFILCADSAKMPVVNIDAYNEITKISDSFKEFLLDYGFLKKDRF